MSKARRARTAQRLLALRAVAASWRAVADGWEESYRDAWAEVARLRAALAEAVWVTNVLGTAICEWCGVEKRESIGKPGCPCAPLRVDAALSPAPRADTPA